MNFQSRLRRLSIVAMESAFALSSGIAGVRSRFPPPEDGDWAEGRGRLSVRDGWRFLHLEGTPAEMGVQQGRLLGPLVRRAFEEYMRMICLWRGLSRRQFLRRGRRLEPFIPPAFAEEMRGLAEGAGMDYDDILVAHTFLETIQSLMCSCFAAHGASTLGGEMIFGRNLDFPSMGIAHRCGIIAFRRPDRGIPFLSISWPGWCGTITAVNLAGLCVGTMDVAQLNMEFAGIPRIFLFRRMVQEAATCDEAVALLGAAPRTCANNVLLAQTAPARRAVVAEYTAGEVAVREERPGNDFIASTNHFRKLGRKAEWPEEKGYGRYCALVGLLRARRGEIALRTGILSDGRVRLPNSLHTLIAAPERRTCILALGRIPAAAGPYRTFTYDDQGIRLPSISSRRPVESPASRGDLGPAAGPAFCKRPRPFV
jgi:hypothetical protein